MEVRELMKEWRIWILLVALAGSLFFLGPHYEPQVRMQLNDSVTDSRITNLLERSGGSFQVESVSVQNAGGVYEATIVSNIGASQLKNILEEEGYDPKILSTGYALVTNIKKGLELQGGTKMLLSVQSNNTSQAQVNQIKNILETRVSAFGLTQTDIRTVRLGDDYRIQVEVANANQTRLERLVAREGSFESRLPLPVRSRKEFTLDKTYTFRKNGETIRVANHSYLPGESFRLDGAKFYYKNSSESVSNLEVVAYSGQDVKQVLVSDAIVRPSGDGYSFRFPVIISTEAARNVQRVAANYRTITLRGQPYLGLENGEPAKLRLYVDDSLQSSLNVAASFKREGNIVTQPSISGGGATAAKARQDMKELQSILKSGRLPAPVKIDSISKISSSLGGEFMKAAIISILASLVAVLTLVYTRYRSLNVALPIFVTGSSEVFILIGGWFSTAATLNLASIAGIVAAVGTGVDDQIIIADESGREKVRSWTKRMKRAFFVIFTSAASTIGAMTPLVSPELSDLAIIAAGVGLIGYSVQRGLRSQYLVIGSFALAVGLFGRMLNPSGFALQAVQGFAITTILGVMVGITITRPAYAKLLEYLER